MTTKKSLTVRTRGDGKSAEVAPALPLLPKEREFADQYFHGEWAGNATRSYLAVYPNASYATASVEASDLLREPRVRRYLEELHAKAVEATAGTLRDWAELLPMAQAVIVSTAQGKLKNRMALDAALYLTNRVMGTPTAVASTEVVVRDGRRISKAIEAFHKRMADEQARGGRS